MIVIGRSLGSASRRGWRARGRSRKLVLVTPYDSLLGIAQRQFSVLSGALAADRQVRVWRYVPRITAPVLIFAAENDELIPAASTARLFSRFPAGQATLVMVPGASHNTIGDTAVYANSLAALDARH